jgi:hypothetical protein
MPSSWPKKYTGLQSLLKTPIAPGVERYGLSARTPSLA